MSNENKFPSGGNRGRRGAGTVVVTDLRLPPGSPTTSITRRHPRVSVSVPGSPASTPLLGTVFQSGNRLCLNLRGPHHLA